MIRKSKVESRKSKVKNKRFFTYRFTMGIVLVVIIALSSTFVFAQPASAPKPATTPTSPKPAASAPADPAKPTDPAAPKATPDPVSSLSAPTGGLKLGSDQRQPLNLFLRDSLTVKALWSTILRIADTFVVLFLLAIAFATILHISYDTYGIKKAILPLIIGIIVSHFSLVIVQNFTDFAQVMSAGMYNAASSGQGALGMATNISKTFFTGGLAALGSGNGGLVTSDMLIGLFTFAFVVPEASGAIFLGLLVLALIMIAIPTLLILVLSFLLYARFYLITVLTIIAPLAWLTIMWSPVQGFFKTWWKQFTQWVFMAPVAIFFIWLSIAFSQSSMANGEANFGTYLLSLVMLYLAIQTPFKMGGQVTATMDKYGRGKALPVAQKYGGMAANAGLNKVGSSKIPAFLGGKGGATWSSRGVAGTDAYKDFFEQKFGLGAKDRRALNTSELLGMGRFGNKEQAERVRRNAEEERLDKLHWGAGSTQSDRLDKIERGDLSPDDALKVIEMMAHKGEDVMTALEKYVNQAKYGGATKTSPFDSTKPKDIEFSKRFNNIVEATKPYLMKADAQTKADHVAMTAFNDRKSRAIDAWYDRDNIKKSSKDFGKVKRITEDLTMKGAVQAAFRNAITDAAAHGGTHTTVDGKTYTRVELQAEFDRIDRSTDATASHIDLGTIHDTISGADVDYNDKSGMADVLKRLRTDPSMCRELERTGAAAPIQRVTHEI